MRFDVPEMTGVSHPVPPADCDPDRGRGFELGRIGPGAPVCAGDTVGSHGGPVLVHGRSAACLSEQAGIACTNRQGHGFTVAKACQRVF